MTVATVALSFAVGFLAARLTWMASRTWFAQPAIARPNYRGKAIPTAVGVIIPVAAFVVEACRSVAGSTGLGDDFAFDGARFVTLLAASGFCLLGMVDDVAGSGDYRGFRGHVLALMAGHVTTGALKLIGGVTVALVVVSPLSGDDVPGGSLGRFLADAALVALAANLANLLDRAPGRMGKGALASFVLLAIASRADRALAGAAVVVGALAALLRDDLRERLMLGDAGANAVGATLGLGVVLTARPNVRNVVLVVVALLNLAGELVSFSRVVEAVPPLRALDRMGRRAT